MKGRRIKSIEVPESVLIPWREKVERFRKLHPDWDSVLDACTDVPFNDLFQAATMNIENGPAVVYFLATNRERAIDLDRMSPIMGLVEIGRLSEKLRHLQIEGN